MQNDEIERKKKSYKNQGICFYSTWVNSTNPPLAI